MDYISSQGNLFKSSMSGRATISLLDLDITEPVDIKYATNYLGNNSEQLFYDMLERLESLSINSGIKKLTEGYR